MTERWNRLVPPPTPPTAHLDDSELAEVELTGDAHKHVADCAWCLHRREAMTAEDRDELNSLLAELDARTVTTTALQTAAAWSLPHQLTELLIDDETQPPEVAPAQLWRLSWRGQDALAVVLERTSWWVRVAPLTTDTWLADEYTLLTEEATTALNCAAAVFMRAEASVPMYTFARYLGDVGGPGEHDTDNRLRRLEVSYLQQLAPPADVPTGPPLEPDDWDRLEALDALNELMRWFESAAFGVFDESGLIAGRGQDTSDEAVEARELLSRPGLDLRELVKGTELPPARLNDLKTGRARPSADDRAALERYFGVPVRDDGHPQNARLALLELLSQPSHRATWSNWRRHNSDSRQLTSPEAGEGTDGESLVLFMQHELDLTLAARSIGPRPAQPGPGGSLKQWHEYWAARLAMRGTR